MKLLLVLFSIVIAVFSSDLNVTIQNSNEEIIQSNPQPLVDLDKIKNNTKDAADRIFKLLTSNKESTTEILPTEKPGVDNKKHPLFDSFNHHHHHHQHTNPFNIFGLHSNDSPPPKPIKTIDEPLCTCKPSYFEPTLPTYIPSSHSSSTSLKFNDENTPTFEVVYPQLKDYFSDSVETPPLVNHYPPLDLNNIWKYEGSSGFQSTRRNDNL